MKHRLAAAIVRRRGWILAAMLIAAALSVFGVGRTRINYDLTRYLNQDSMTRRALTVMEEEFGSTEQLRVMFRDLDETTLADYVRAMNDLDEILLASHDPEIDVRETDGARCQLVTLTLGDCDASRMVERLRAMFPEAGEYAVGGSAAQQLDLQESVAAEIPGVMLISIAVVVAVLLATSCAWLEPAVILFVLAVSVLINMGTHFIFPDVSFITFAVSAILQLALSIDYAIMLLHAYNDLRERENDAPAAMTAALEQCFMRIASSAFTTVAGLLSLLFMSFTIGFDIGLALSKGIVVSMAGVFLLMPAATLLCEKGLRRTRHKPLRLGGEHLAAFLYRYRGAVAAALALAVAAGFWLQTGNRYTFTDAGRSARNTQSRAISDVFGQSDPMVLLVPGGDSDADYDTQRALVEAIQSIRVDGEEPFGEISAMVTTGAQALRYYTADEVAELSGMDAFAVRLFFTVNGFGESVRADRLLQAASILAAGNETVASLRAALATAQTAFNGPRYARMVIATDFNAGDDVARPAIDALLEAARGLYGDDIYLTGVAMSSYDIGSAFEGDLTKVNLITFAAILLIVAVSFRSLPLPLAVVFVIEGAIWITMGISRLQREPIFFMSYLICVSIQMGATIDYGILLSDQYRSLRLAGEAPQQALAGALRRAMPTILTSGVILVTAGAIIGLRCSVYYISAIGLLLSRGAAVSVALVLTLLPALLTLGDALLIRRRSVI